MSLKLQKNRHNDGLKSGIRLNSVSKDDMITNPPSSLNQH